MRGRSQILLLRRVRQQSHLLMQIGGARTIGIRNLHRPGGIVSFMPKMEPRFVLVTFDGTPHAVA